MVDDEEYLIKKLNPVSVPAGDNKITIVKTSP